MPSRHAKPTQHWRKQGLIFTAEEHQSGMARRAYVPFVDPVSADVWRIYFGSRDRHGHAFPTFIDVEAGNPANVLYVQQSPLLELGRSGRFDEAGVLPTTLVTHQGRKYLYYSGFSKPAGAPFHMSLGLAISDDGGRTFERASESPVLDVSTSDPFMILSAFALVDEGVWKLWYTSGAGWITIDGQSEPVYHVKYAESADGVSWQPHDVICLKRRDEREANGRPCVLRESDGYRMWYSYRGSVHYRTDRSQSYRIGYAESADGRTWTRKDDEVGIDVSDAGWDSQMIEYPFVLAHQGRKYLFYNGNGFGDTGFGYAVLDE